jgi:hypothetical protein
MNVKKILLWLSLLVAALSVMAFLTYDFPGWCALVERSPCIIIARCKSSPERVRFINGVKVDNPMVSGPMGGIVLSDIKIVSVLKGDNVKLASTTLWSKYWPYQGESYLLFATDYDGTNCKAFDLYRIVPLGHFFPTNILTGKSLDDQIKALLQYRLNNLNLELEHEQTEKERLEKGLKN